MIALHLQQIIGASCVLAIGAVLFVFSGPTAAAFGGLLAAIAVVWGAASMRGTNSMTTTVLQWFPDVVPSPPVPTPTVLLTENNFDTPVAVDLDTVFAMDLESNPSTSLQWSVDPSENVQILQETDVSRTTRWVFKVTSGPAATITFIQSGHGGVQEKHTLVVTTTTPTVSPSQVTPGPSRVFTKKNFEWENVTVPVNATFAVDLAPPLAKRYTWSISLPAHVQLLQTTTSVSGTKRWLFKVIDKTPPGPAVVFVAHPIDGGKGASNSFLLTVNGPRPLA